MSRINGPNNREFSNLIPSNHNLGQGISKNKSNNICERVLKRLNQKFPLPGLIADYTRMKLSEKNIKKINPWPKICGFTKSHRK